jgi:hypothetical protein
MQPHFFDSFNGAAQLSGPRFGPQGAAGISYEKDWKVRQQLGRPLRREQVLAQGDGVRYSTPVIDYRHYRYMDYSGGTYGATAQAPFDAEDRDFWEAIAIWRSGTAPELAEQPPTVQRTIATQNFIINIAAGLKAASRADIPVPMNFPSLEKPGPFYNINTDEQLAAYLASHFETHPIKGNDPKRTRALVPTERTLHSEHHSVR